MTAGLIICFCSTVFQQDSVDRILRVKVSDANGDIVTGAKVKIRTRGSEVTECAVSPGGTYECTANVDSTITIFVEAEGFRPLEKNFAALGGQQQVETLVLEHLPLREKVVVVATGRESRLGDTPASVAVLHGDDLRKTASPTVDDTLRQSIGFSLFRRSNSRNANPTTQGVSLRSINGSGASRSLVTLDSVRINDPFGGWISWSSVPRLTVERIEVVRGGASSLYGSDSLGGVVEIVTRRPKGKYESSAEIFGGSQGTYSGSAFVGTARRSFSADIAVSGFRTRGFRPVREPVRGLVDDVAGSRNSNYSVRFAPARFLGTELFLRASYFGESRTNGTPIQRNRTHIRRFSFGSIHDLPALTEGSPKAKVTISGFGTIQLFDQSFSAVASDRDSENLVRIQRVPSQSVGLSATFSAVAGRHALRTGIEASETRGASNETGFFFSGATRSRSGAGGRERTLGIYVADTVDLGKGLLVTARLRVDRWRNYRALISTASSSSGQPSATSFPARSETAVSPSFSLLHHFNDKLSVYALASRSFRAPTLNELYRGFRVGNVVTGANEGLKSETADNLEAGISFGEGSFQVRGSGFFTRVSNAIANVTTDTSNGLILRQRQNAGSITVRGLEIEIGKRIRRLVFSFGYLLSEARFSSFPSNTVLEGLRVPQAPLNSASFQTRYEDPAGFTVALQGRSSGSQYDDDLNTFRLRSFFQLDTFISREFDEKWELFVAVENLLNSRYPTRVTPVINAAAPLTVRAGLRWN